MDQNHFALHRHPEVSLEVVEVETLLILQESQCDLLLEVGGPVSRWMFSVPDLLQQILFVHQRLEIWIFHFWVKYYILCIESFLSRFPMRPSFPAPQCLQPLWLTKRQATSRPDHLWPELWRGMSKNAELRERSISEQLKNQSSIMQEDYEESVSLTLRFWSSRKSLKKTKENWKHQWLQPCLARLARKTSMWRPVARLMISRINWHVSWKPVDPQECVWKKLYRNIMRTISQEKETIQCTITKWYTHLFLCLKQWRYPQQKQQWIKNAKRKSETNQRWSMKQGLRA